MKALLLLFLLILYPLNSFAEIDERKTDVYFANGIKTNEGNATANTRLLREEIISVIYSGNLHTFDKKIGKVTEAYNNTHGMGFDVIESLDQKLNVVKWKDWLAGLVGYVTSHASDLKKQINAYRDSISSGHGVLVVAHSQGNLFTKEAYDALDPCMQKQFEAVSIASPMHADIKEETSFNLNNISA